MWRLNEKEFEDEVVVVTKSNAPGQVTFLGTGACIPGKYRNVSSIHVDVSGGVLLDCGEGTLGQLKRMAIIDPKIICITHMHADHHLGVLSLIDTCDLILGPKRLGHLA